MTAKRMVIGLFVLIVLGGIATAIYRLTGGLVGPQPAAWIGALL